MRKTRLKNVDYLLAGDLGGTKTSLALFDLSKSVREVHDIRTFTNDQYESFNDLLSVYLSTGPKNVRALIVGAAGPVIDGEVVLTNLDWTLSIEKLQKDFGFENVWLINDLQAGAEAISILKQVEVKVLHEGQPVAGGNMAIIAPGTGLGEAFLVMEQGEYRAVATEGGNSSFAPENEIQLQLLEFMRDIHNHVSVEAVCSGSAIPGLYEFIKDNSGLEESPEIAAELAASDDFSAKVFDLAVSSPGKSALCQKTLNLFVEILGAELSNFALKIGATGGVYLGGGIPPKIVAALQEERFLNAFFDKGRYRNYMERIPVRLILNSGSPVLGAAHYGYKKLKKQV